MADAVIVVESGVKGGSLTTADIANSYFREVFALPGRIHDKMSTGCNQLISDNQAVLLRGSEHFISHMGWEQESEPALPVQKELFQELSGDEEKVFNSLSLRGAMQVNTLAIELNIPVTELFLTLLGMEMKNIVKSLPGGMYQLV